MVGRLRWGHSASEHLAERQGLWAEMRRQVRELSDREQRQTAIHPYVALARQAGSGGEEIADLIGDELGWRVLDRQALDAIAEEFRLDPKMLALLDETRLSWFGESILNLVHSRLISQDTYVERLVKLVLVSLSDSPAVVVGRGSTAFLPRDRGLAVRLVREEADRVALIMGRLALSESEARRWVNRTDQERRAFVRHHFNQDPDDPVEYDLVLNTSRVDLHGAARIIVQALRTRGLLAGSPTPSPVGVG
jgi:cytidylate kinase